MPAALLLGMTDMADLQNYLSALPEGDRKEVENRVSKAIAMAHAHDATKTAPMYVITAEISPAELGWERVAPCVWQRKSDGLTYRFAPNHREVFVKMIQVPA